MGLMSKRKVILKLSLNTTLLTFYTSRLKEKSALLTPKIIYKKHFQTNLAR